MRASPDKRSRPTEQGIAPATKSRPRAQMPDFAVLIPPLPPRPGNQAGYFRSPQGALAATPRRQLRPAAPAETRLRVRLSAGAHRIWRKCEMLHMLMAAPLA